MAGVTDRPFRELCLSFGAGLAVSEMMSSNPQMWHTEKSLQRLVQVNESGIRAVQIAGAEPQLMANAARYCVSQGAQIIDINMGCPVKKVNRKLAGSALLEHPHLIKQILSAVVNAVNVPVTLKTRTGWNTQNKNCVEIAKIAQDCGIQAIALHGRTKACMYTGNAEYESILAVKKAVSIPVIANGDIDSPQKAKRVLEYTDADGLMIGRSAQGRPWIFYEIQHYLTTGEMLSAPSLDSIKPVLLGHVHAIHQFYGELKGTRIARKHVGWYLKDLPKFGEFRHRFNSIEQANMQLGELEFFFANAA